MSMTICPSDDRFLVFFFLPLSGRLIINDQKKDGDKTGGDTGGFVVDTFHDLVSKLKEKETELEDLRKNAEERAGAVEIQ
jgi:hypothetical protein